MEKLWTQSSYFYYYCGKRSATQQFAWWKDNIQYVGIDGKTLQEANKELYDSEMICRKQFIERHSND